MSEPSAGKGPRVAIIGAGAAGCFCAIELKRRLPQASVVVYEAGSKPLAKVAVTGGGRCNFTNSFRDVERLEDVYPRGARLMKRLLAAFGPSDVRAWFEREGVPSVVQEDQCVFPESQDAMQIVRTLLRLMRELGVRLECGRRIGGAGEIDADAVVVTVGGNSERVLRSLLPSDIEITPTVPSLFTFRIGDEALCSLMGTVAADATVGLAGTPLRASGPLLITDWGVSGPAVLRLSSYAARHLAEAGWKGTLLVNWAGLDEARARSLLSALGRENPQKMVSSTPAQGLSGRLWKHIAGRAGLRADIRWSELGSKGLSRLVNSLLCDSYPITGRARFKEEFVTCGGVALGEVDPRTLQCRKHPGLYFAGEVLDVDALTGGFNLQAAWSSAVAVAAAIAQSAAEL